jgi:hypothetical protein
MESGGLPIDLGTRLTLDGRSFPDARGTVGIRDRRSPHKGSAEMCARFGGTPDSAFLERKAGWPDPEMLPIGPTTVIGDNVGFTRQA